ncbi:MAG: hypothetical protein KIS92_01330 [Planctomycetota bacterium]|nr:hypothetical protein [Planctomycetota bacterium]
MRRPIRTRVLAWPAACLLAATSAACAEAPAETEKPAAFELKTVQNDPNDAARVAREAVRTFLSEADYQARAKKLKEKFEAWREESHDDMARYLNDRLVGVALAAASGKPDRLKEGAVFLSFYHEFKQPLPAVVTDFVRDHHASLQHLFQAFTWEAAGAYVRAKPWRKAAAEAKSAEKSEKGPAKDGEK